MNKTCKTLSSIGMALLRGVVSLLMCLCFLVAALSFSLKQTVAEQTLYRRAAQNPALPQELVEYVRDDLENECLFYGLPLEIVDEALSADMAQDFIITYVDAVYDTVFVSGKLVIPAVDASVFRAPIAARLEAEGVEADVIDQLASEFAAITTASWQMGLSQKLLSPVHKIFGNVWIARFFNSGALFAAATLVLFGIGMLLNLRRIRRGLFNQLGALTVTSMVLFVPLWLLHDYGLAAKLVLGDSPLRTFMITVMDSITAQLYSTSLWVMVVLAVLTVAATVWLVWPAKETASADVAAEEVTEAAAEETAEIPAEAE